VRFALVPLTRTDRNRADVDDKTIAISSDPRTRETMRRRAEGSGWSRSGKRRAHCALSGHTDDDRRTYSSQARGALCFKAVARKQIRTMHVARISRPTVCDRVWDTSGWICTSSLSPMPTGVFSSSCSSLQASPKGARAHRQLRHFIAGVTCRARN